MAEIRRISKNGHSLQVVLPREFLEALQLRAGQQVFLELVHDTIVLSKAYSARAYDDGLRLKLASPRD